MPEHTRLMAYRRNPGRRITAARSLGWLEFDALRTIFTVPSDLNPTGVKEKEEGNLLIEAVALLVQRQRESESWIDEQIGLAEDRASVAERRYAELEARLERIEAQLERLTSSSEPASGSSSGQASGDRQVEHSLARLREQLEELRASGDGHMVRLPAGAVQHPESAQVVAVPSAAVLTAAGDAAEAAPIPEAAEAVPGREAAEAALAREGPDAQPVPVVRARASRWEVFGANPQDRFGLALIGLGLVAVVYALLSQVRFN
jgi:hypothetical protein